VYADPESRKEKGELKLAVENKNRVASIMKSSQEIDTSKPFTNPPTSLPKN